LIVYLDTSALVKLIVAERESVALRRFLRSHPERVTAALARTELSRTCPGESAAVRQRARQVLQGLDIVPLTDLLLDLAGELLPRRLRSLDAIHLAAAKLVGADRVVTYDRRMGSAARELGLELEAPR